LPLAPENKTGLDKSLSMLEVAKKKSPFIKFVQGSMEDFQLGEKFDLIVCTHDSLNYLLLERQLLEHFSCVKRHLKAGGYYIFDCTTEYNVQQYFHGKVFKKQSGNLFMEWTNSYEKQTRIVTSILRFEEASKEGKFSSVETHIQKIYTTEELLLLLQKSGLELVKLGSDYKKWKYNVKTSLMNFLVKHIE
jgi:SAM-dependent methyltransferase